MQFFLFILIFFTPQKIEKCEYNGMPLYGRIQFVENFEDVTVKIVEDFPDLRVKIVDDFPYDCGQWKIVDDFPDLKVKIVSSGEDLRVKFVESFEGLN